MSTKCVVEVLRESLIADVFNALAGKVERAMFLRKPSRRAVFQRNTFIPRTITELSLADSADSEAKFAESRGALSLRLLVQKKARNTLNIENS